MRCMKRTLDDQQCFKAGDGVGNGQTRAIVKLPPGYSKIRTFFIIDVYSPQEIQFRRIKSRVLLPGRPMRIAAFLQHQGPGGGDLVVSFEDVLSPIPRIRGPIYQGPHITISNELCNITRSYVHIEDGFFPGFLSQFDKTTRQ
jgi:hypothetical protein